MTAISAISFLVDQVFLSAPDSAVADLAAVSSEDTPKSRKKNKGVPAANVTPTTPDLYDPSLPYLDKLPQLSFRRDVFAPTPEMLKHYRQLEEQDNTGAAVTGPKPNSPEAFKADHELQATFSSPEMAFINGKLLRVGNEIAGFRLIRIGPYHVELKRGRELVQLYMPTPDGPAKPVKQAPAPTSVEEPPPEQ